jgi:hypothetical protein
MVEAGSSYVAPARQRAAAASIATAQAERARPDQPLAGAALVARQARQRELEDFFGLRLAVLARAVTGTTLPGDAEKLAHLAGTPIARELAEARARQQAEDDARSRRQRASYDGDPLHDPRLTAVIARPGASWDEINRVRTEVTAEYAERARVHAAAVHAADHPVKPPVQVSQPLPSPDAPDSDSAGIAIRPGRASMPQPANAPLAMR